MMQNIAIKKCVHLEFFTIVFINILNIYIYFISVNIYFSSSHNLFSF